MGRETGELELCLIAAVARNGVIGRDGSLPWRLRTDLRRFKRLTEGHPVIMGRLTHESVGRALPGRLNLVLTRSEAPVVFDGAEAVPSLARALQRARETGAERVYVIGGAAVYEMALPRADRLDLTWVDADVDGDVHFPEIDLETWELIEEVEVPRSELDEYPTVYRRYARRPAQTPEAT